MAHGTKQMSGQGGRRAGFTLGFTLIELLVVVSIIVILIGILVPTLSKVREMARVTDTKNEMAGLQTAISRYATDFGAPPGPISDSLATGSAMYIGTGTTFTANQNLLIGLTRAFTPGTTNFSDVGTPNFVANPVTITTTGGTFYADLAATTPRDYSKLDSLPNSGGTYIAGRAYDAYWTPGPKDIYTPPTGGTYPGTNLNYPVIVDHFLDPMPILYFRAMPGNDNALSVTPPAVPAFNATLTSNGHGAFFTNIMQSTTGVKYDQSTSTYLAGNLQNVLYTQVGIVNGNPNYVPVGGFVLISAGTDRFYGKSGNANDDIIVSGGGH